MTAERFQTIERLFHECLACEAPARAAFLDSACAGDPLLRREIEALLAVQPEAGAVLESVVQAGLSVAQEGAGACEGRRIGPYQLVRELGSGGMGIVYLARRADQEYEKQVAIKVVQRGFATEVLLHRFRQERQILARLEHPNIARLLDGGVTSDGLPYLVMEYVQGESILQYCDAAKLPIRERLKLFRQVCSTIQYAHQNLVVHRDLKPGNLLVTADGVPKLLDFGIAKLLRPPDTAAEGDEFRTLTDYAPLTPQYASPEQIQGGPITTATDVYSLGALLYELLAGLRPYSFRGFAPQEIERVICGQEPEPPSAALKRRAQSHEGRRAVAEIAANRRTMPERLRRQLAGDLDSIVVKAIEKAPQRRYVSAEQLSEDLHRHAEGLPVEARRHTFAYRSARFVRRYRVAIGAAALLLTGIAGFAVMTHVESLRIAEERDKAAQVSNFLVGLFKVSDPGEARGNKVTAREILDKGAEKVARELKNEPGVRATMLDAIGTVYYSLGLYDRAVALLRDALALRTGTLGRDDSAIAQTEVYLARALADRGDSAEAERLYRDGMRREGSFARQHPELVASIRNGLGALYYAESRLDEALALDREALDIRRRLAVENVEFAEALQNYGLTLADKGRYSEAEPLMRESIAMLRRVAGNDCPQLAVFLNNMASTLSYKGDVAAAEPFAREALAIKRKLYGDDHPTVAVSMTTLAGLLHARGQDTEAEALLRRALDLRRKAFPPGHLHVAHGESQLGKFLLDKGELAEAEPLLRRGYKVLRKLRPNDRYLVPEAEAAWGRCLAGLHRYREAEPLLTESYPILKESRGPNRKQTRDTADALLQVYQALGRTAPLPEQPKSGLRAPLRTASPAR